MPAGQSEDELLRREVAGIARLVRRADVARETHRQRPPERDPELDPQGQWRIRAETALELTEPDAGDADARAQAVQREAAATTCCARVATECNRKAARLANAFNLLSGASISSHDGGIIKSWLAWRLSGDRPARRAIVVHRCARSEGWRAP